MSAGMGSSIFVSQRRTTPACPVLNTAVLDVEGNIELPLMCCVSLQVVAIVGQLIGNAK